MSSSNRSEWSQLCTMVYAGFQTICILSSALLVFCSNKPHVSNLSLKKKLGHLWKYKFIYTFVLTTIYDQATDIGVMAYWWELKDIPEIDKVDHIDLHLLFYTNLFFMLFSRFAFMYVVLIHFESDWYDWILALFDLYIIKHVWIAIRDDKNEPTWQTRDCHWWEISIESLPQVVFSSVFIIRRYQIVDNNNWNNWDNIIFASSIMTSLFAAASKYINMDKNDKRFDDSILNSDVHLTKCPIINLGYVGRVIWRVIEVVCRSCLYVLLWAIVGGWFLIFYIILNFFAMVLLFDYCHCLSHTSDEFIKNSSKSQVDVQTQTQPKSNVQLKFPAALPVPDVSPHMSTQTTPQMSPEPAEIGVAPSTVLDNQDHDQHSQQDENINPLQEELETKSRSKSVSISVLGKEDINSEELQSHDHDQASHVEIQDLDVEMKQSFKDGAIKFFRMIQFKLLFFSVGRMFAIMWDLNKTNETAVAKRAVFYQFIENLVGLAIILPFGLVKFECSICADSTTRNLLYSGFASAYMVVFVFCIGATVFMFHSIPKLQKLDQMIKHKKDQEMMSNSIKNMSDDSGTNTKENRTSFELQPENKVCMQFVCFVYIVND